MRSIKRSDDRRTSAARWAMDPAITTGRPVADLACAMVRANDLLDLMERHYWTAKRLLPDDSGEISSLARVMDELHAHHSRMAHLVLLARDVDGAFPAGPEPAA